MATPIGSVDSGWNCFRKRKKRLSSDGSEYIPTVQELEPHSAIDLSDNLSDFEGHSEEVVQLPEPENVVVLESEVPRTTEEKLKHFEHNFQDLIAGLSTYEARTGDFKTRVNKIQMEMNTLYREKDRMEVDIKGLVDLIIKQRENATRVLGNRIVLREADVKETRERTGKIEKELTEKIDSLGGLKRKIDAASSTDFRLREEIKADLRKTNAIVSRYMEEIETLNRNKIVQLKVLRQGRIKHKLINVAEYRSASRDLNAEVGFLIEQKQTMFEKIESIEDALTRLSVVTSPIEVVELPLKTIEIAEEEEILDPESPKPKTEKKQSFDLPPLPPLKDWNAMDDLVIPSLMITSRTSEPSESVTTPPSQTANSAKSVPNIPSIFLSRSSVSSIPTKVSMVIEDKKPTKSGFSLIRTLSRRSMRKDCKKSPKKEKNDKKDKERSVEVEISQGEIAQIVEEKVTLKKVKDKARRAGVKSEPSLGFKLKAAEGQKPGILKTASEGGRPGILKTSPEDKSLFLKPTTDFAKPRIKSSEELSVLGATLKVTPFVKSETITKTVVLNTPYESEMVVSLQEPSEPIKTDMLLVPNMIHSQRKTEVHSAIANYEITSVEDCTPMMMFVDPIESDEISELEVLPSRPKSHHGSMCSVVTQESTRLSVIQPDTSPHNVSPHSDSSPQQVFTMACFRWQLSLSSSPRKRRTNKKHRRSLSANQSPEKAGTSRDTRLEAARSSPSKLKSSVAKSSMAKQSKSKLSPSKSSKPAKAKKSTAKEKKASTSQQGMPQDNKLLRAETHSLPSESPSKRSKSAE